MTYLQTSRVVVIDDELPEAMPIIEALARLRIGSAYFRGTRIEDLPAAPLSGVRLAFLDMQLESHGTPRQIGAHTARVFSRIVDASAVPIMLILWTKHDELVDAFKQALFEGEPRFRTALLVTKMDKPNRAEEIDARRVFAQIEAIITKHFPLDFVWLWEQLAHDATTETTNALCQLVAHRTDPPNEETTDADYLNTWLRELGHVLRYLVRVSVGKNVAPQRAGIDALEVLAAMHQDRLDQEVIAGAPADLSALFGQQEEPPEKEEQAAVNSMLLAAPHHDKDFSIRPGSVFAPQPELEEECVFAQCDVDVAALGAEILRLTKDKDYAGLAKRMDKATGRNDEEEKTKVGPLLSKRLGELVNCCIPILLETSPTCDYAQRNRYVSRFLGGLLVPDEMERMIDNKGSLQQVEAINPPGLDGIWHPVFSGRFVYSLPRPEMAVKGRPLFRLRSGLLTDILHWYGAQSSRPGYMSLHAR